MWLSILAVVIISIFEHMSLKTYRIYGELPQNVKKRDLITLWVSSVIIIAVLLMSKLGLSIPGII